jgi:hypothetical protein
MWWIKIHSHTKQWVKSESCKFVTSGSHMMDRKTRDEYVVMCHNPSKASVHVCHPTPPGFLFGSIFNRENGGGMSHGNAGWLLLDYVVTSQKTEHPTSTGMRTSNPTLFPLIRHHLHWVLVTCNKRGTELLPLSTSYFIPLINCHNYLTCWPIPLSSAFLK